MAERRPSSRRAIAAVVLVLIAMVVGVLPLGAQEQPPSPSASPSELRETADEILQRQEFQRPEPTLIEKAQDWLGERISEFIGGVTGGGAGSVVGWFVLVAAVAALVWSLTRLGRSVKADPAASAHVRIDQGRTPDAWRAEAERLESDGAWKEALRCRYRALLGDLVRAGIIEDVPGRTTGEYRREVEPTLPEAAGAFGELTELFEWAWYADLPTGPAESERFRAAAQVVVDRAGQGRQAKVGVA